MILPSKFQLGQIVDVVAGGFTLSGVSIVGVTFFAPDAPAGILGSNNETENEQGVSYILVEPCGEGCYLERVAYAWMLKLSNT